MTWQRLALCRTHTEDWWTLDNPTAEQTATAKAICRTCPARQACLDWAMTTEPRYRRYGILGGYTARQRTLLDKRGRTLHGNSKADPQHVRQLIADYTTTRGTRYGAIRHTARTLGIAENTVRDILNRRAA